MVRFKLIIAIKRFVEVLPGTQDLMEEVLFGFHNIDVLKWGEL